MPVLEQNDATQTAQLLDAFLRSKPLCHRYTVGINGMENCTGTVPVLSCICPDVYNKLTDINDADEDERNYKRNIRLKELLCDEFRNLDEHGRRDLAVWIIRRWGGINRNFRNDGLTMQLVNADISGGMATGYERIRIASPIPSRSKVLSFLDPMRYAICDSRAVFSLNWLLFIAAQKNAGGTVRLFKSLASGNMRVQGAGTPLSVAGERFPELAVTEERNRYADYCAAVGELTALLKQKQRSDWKFYQTEMLLFALADGGESGIPHLVRELKQRNTDFSTKEAMKIIAEKSNGGNE